MGDEGSLPLVSVSDADVVVSPSDIKLGEDLGILHLVYEFLDQQEGVGILDSVGVDVSVIFTGSEGVRGILFVNEEEGGCLRGV